MNDDIVTRLRDRAKERIEANEEYWRGHKFEYEIPILEDQAADEIELLLEWKELAYEMRNKYWWCMRTKMLEKFEKMHLDDWARHG